MSKRTAPPVPEKLRELLKDYPEHIASLQEALGRFSASPSKLQPFDEAVWLLEDGLADFMTQASVALEAAMAGHDLAAIAQARRKAETMSLARSKARWITDEGLWNYFQEN